MGGIHIPADRLPRGYELLRGNGDSDASRRHRPSLLAIILVILHNNVICCSLLGLIMATTISENSLNEIAQWIDDIGGQLYAKVHELYALQQQLNTLKSMIEDYRDDPEGRFR